MNWVLIEDHQISLKKEWSKMQKSLRGIYSEDAVHYGKKALKSGKDKMQTGISHTNESRLRQCFQ